MGRVRVRLYTDEVAYKLEYSRGRDLGDIANPHWLVGGGSPRELAVGWHVAGPFFLAIPAFHRHRLDLSRPV